MLFSLRGLVGLILGVAFVSGGLRVMTGKRSGLALTQAANGLHGKITKIT
jgi:hypothetical protein